MPRMLTYGEVMQGRSTRSPSRGTWAAYIAAVRSSTGLNKTDFGRRIGVDRGTVNRWETQQTHPNDPTLFERIAKVFALPPEDVFAAAGLRPSAPPPIEPEREPDPDLQVILRSDLPRRMKDELVEHLMQSRERDQQRRLEDIQRMIRIARGRAS